MGTLTEERTYFVSIIINEKTSLLVLTPPNVLYIDTRLHGSHAAVIVKGTYPNLTDLCEVIWELESHGKNTCRNLNFLQVFQG